MLNFKKLLLCIFIPVHVICILFTDCLFQNFAFSFKPIVDNNWKYINLKKEYKKKYEICEKIMQDKVTISMKYNYF